MRVPRAGRCSDNTGIIAQQGRLDAHLRVQDRPVEMVEPLSNALEQVVACQNHPAGEHDHLRVEQSAEIDAYQPQPFGHIVDDALGQCVDDHCLDPDCQPVTFGEECLF